MKKMTLVGAAVLLAAVATLGGCASDNSGAVAQNGHAATCADKASGCCADKSAEAKAGATCTGGEAKASGCCAGKAATAK
ncbi:MAG TPA: hypothetical protein VEB22_13325 [Phycisphaerales bacterium]|nr:hypothetical protein [Phycisphaerales bacterium]